VSEQELNYENLYSPEYTVAQKNRENKT